MHEDLHLTIKKNVDPDQRGLTLIELILFIVIVGAALAGTLLAYQRAAESSGDPVLRKQAIAIAESLLDEVTLHPFTYCDPTDANALYARAADTAPGNCAATPEVMGPEAGQTRYAAGSPFNNVNDYDGFTMLGNPGLGIIRLGNNPADAVPGLENYTATVAVTAEAGGLRVDVRVQVGPEDITLTAYRFMVAPNFGG